MKLTLEPDMNARRAEAERRADLHFAMLIERLCLYPDLYRRKAAEAAACLAGGESGPLIRAEIRARGGEPMAIARAIAEKAAAHEGELARIEQARLAIKSRIRAATAPAGLDAILAELEITP